MSFNEIRKWNRLLIDVEDNEIGQDQKRIFIKHEIHSEKIGRAVMYSRNHIYRNVASTKKLNYFYFY